MKCCPAINQRVSPESLSTLTMVFLVIGYLHIAIASTMRTHDWEYMDALYFWMVTLTTVGFGDMNIPIREHGGWFPYRLGGLALIAGLIDSLSSWMKSRKVALEKVKSIARKISQRGQDPNDNVYEQRMKVYDNNQDCHQNNKFFCYCFVKNVSIKPGIVNFRRLKLYI